MKALKKGSHMTGTTFLCQPTLTRLHGLPWVVLSTLHGVTRVMDILELGNQAVPVPPKFTLPLRTSTTYRCPTMKTAKLSTTRGTLTVFTRLLMNGINRKKSVKR